MSSGTGSVIHWTDLCRSGIDIDEVFNSINVATRQAVDTIRGAKTGSIHIGDIQVALNNHCVLMTRVITWEEPLS